MNVDEDKTNLYEVNELTEYNGSGFSNLPEPTQKERNDSNKWKLLLVCLLIAILFINIIIFLMSAANLYYASNAVPAACQTQNSSTAATTGSLTSSEGPLNNCSIVNSTWTDSLMRYNMAMENNVNRLINATLNNARKIDDIAMSTDQQSSVVENNTYTLDDILNITNDATRMLTGIIHSLATHDSTLISTSAITDDIQIVLDRLLELHNSSNIFNSILPISCSDILAAYPSSTSGYYHVNSRHIYCNMGELCGSSGGWTRIGFLDMNGATSDCPPGFRLYQVGAVRACGRPVGGPSCVSEILPTNGINYTQICGRVTGYQWASPDAVDTRFRSNAIHNDINSYYVDGVSITRGSPRQHVWTFMAGVRDSSYDAGNCPCSTPPGATQVIQSFVGNDYFCESGNHANGWGYTLYTSDPLWDGQGCGTQEFVCCAAAGLPWFHRDYGSASSSENLELRLCADETTAFDDIPISYYEIYVK
uniref:Fibrinogen C-terminal domain-containing protein n=1 Tax=Amphimedon queenslandica TaxID=400682 RepID=A0A1X7UHD4_AMPQE